MLKKLTPNFMVEDVRKTIEFYQEVLGFSVITTVDNEDEIGFAIMQREQVELMFQSRKSLSENVPALSGSSIGASQTLYIEVSGIEALYEALRDKVDIVVDMHSTFYGTNEFYFKDINGYILSFSEASAS
jgi:lactoylglutathione lyase